MAESAVAKCELCGEAMPAGEDMFKFHGYSGPCPKPPIAKAREATKQDAGSLVNDGESQETIELLRARAEAAEAARAALLQQIAELKEPAAWRPIETATRGNVAILGWAKGWKWETPVAMWWSVNDCWVSSPGRYVLYPTHWMPLPDPPTLLPADPLSQDTKA